VQHYRSLADVSLQNTWLTIGVFDGVHRGHQAILPFCLPLTRIPPSFCLDAT